MINGDRYGRWLAACAQPDPTAFTSSTSLRTSFERWAAAEGLFIGSARRFANALTSRGFVAVKLGGTAGFRGIRLTV
jgi:hypothetical protein